MQKYKHPSILPQVMSEAYSSRYNLAIEGHEHAGAATATGVPLTNTNTMATDDFVFTDNNNMGSRNRPPPGPAPFVPARNLADGGEEQDENSTTDRDAKTSVQRTSEDRGDSSSTYSLSRDSSALSAIRQRDAAKTPSSPLVREVPQD